MPTAEKLAQIRQINRELTAAERNRVRKAENDLRNFIQALERGEVPSTKRLTSENLAALKKYLDADSGLVDEAE